MTEALIADFTPLPQGVQQLLDGYTRARPDVTVRLWLAEDGGWQCVYPEGEMTLNAPACPSTRIDGRDNQYTLELCGPATGADLEFLADALARVFAYEQEARSAAHELTDRYEEINLLYSISEILASFLSMEKATTRILAEVADVLGARRAALWVADRATNLLVLSAAVGSEGLTAPIDIDDESSVTARVFRERQPINLEQGERLPRTTMWEPRPQGEEPYLSVPVSYTPPDGSGRTVGVMTLVGRRSDVRFSAGDLRLLTAVASQVGAALETQRLVRESVRRERLERELELAHHLQLKLLPDAARFADRARVAARCAPADSVGGDLYHLVELPGGRLGVVIGDVSGHGFSAALIMAMTISAIAIYALEAAQPADVLRHVHQALIDELESTEMYLTIVYAVVDPRSDRIVYANAGHPHAVVIGEDGEVTRLAATSPPLGTASIPDYGESSVPFSGRDLLFLFTDGLSDAFASASVGNGEQRIIDEVCRLCQAEPGQILNEIFATAGAGKAEIPPDDRTAVLVRG